MIQRYDLIIVGGSFAGLACARTAALKGLKVAVIDAKDDPGARMRTTGIVVKEASDDFDLPARHMRKVRGVRLYAPNDRFADFTAPGYFFQATDTTSVMRWLASEAERAGATLLYGRRFETAVEHARGVALPDLGLHASFLIGADGARSRVAENFGLSRNTHFLAGLEIECEPLDALDPRFLHCFADSKIAPGYIAWAVPGVEVTQIGVAARRPAKPDLGELLLRLKTVCDIRDIRVTSRRSGLIPAGGTLKHIGTNRVMLIGDAAGTVSPVTGGGIHTALHFGRRAALLVSDYLADRGAHPVGALAKELPRYRAKLLLRRLLDLAPPNGMINAFLMTGPAKALAQRIYFHTRAGSTESYEAWAAEFERGELSQTPPQLPTPKLRLI
ncbi:MAG: NAD(P)/FAD-dependent oxidoreductase [Alphaproteobacteria bacterium]|nr:NAD(P)/FAD-dependent oxidoreductase [Alphaproteobacteria bacterium]MBL7099619.1 NAD(P)/FAD-dependent oxidoreductase [Alphaproteobacteria bacterium]